MPMFLVHRKGLVLDGNNPTLLYGYGGFNIVVAPDVQRRAARDPRARRGVRVGEPARRRRVRRAWHQPGMKLRKQNVFDDFIAAAEWLVARSTRRRRGWRSGRVERRAARRRGDEPAAGAFRVGIAQVGVMDMLRFQKFTIGWNWIADYGSSDDPEEFKTLYRLLAPAQHQGRRAVPGDAHHDGRHDDRVVPAHSFKYAAALQELAGRETSRPHPDRDQIRPRSEQPDQAARDDGGRLRLHALQSRRHLNLRLTVHGDCAV